MQIKNRSAKTIINLLALMHKMETTATRAPKKTANAIPRIAISTDPITGSDEFDPSCESDGSVDCGLSTLDPVWISRSPC